MSPYPIAAPAEAGANSNRPRRASPPPERSIRMP
jgi:hypothetical protein